MSVETQSNFAGALFDAARPIPAEVTSRNTPRPAKRFAVYRNNVVTGLIGALKTRFPAIVGIVGEEFFGAMAQVFVTDHPPRSPLLMTYGDNFPEFIERFAPAADLPYLADVARIEAARTRACHAADVVPIDPSRFHSLVPTDLARLRVILHPSAEIVRSIHPVVTIWAMNSGEIEPAPIENWHPQDALVLRPALEVEVRQLPPGGAAFLAALAQGHPLAKAAEAALADQPDFDLTANLAGLIGSGLVTDVVSTEPDEDLLP